MKGFVPTPPQTVDTMVELLFLGRSPTRETTVLDPGCGTGEFIDGVIRRCQKRGLRLPRITGVESDPQHLPTLRAKYRQLKAVRIEHTDFLSDRRASYDFIVGNPPYVPITGLTKSEKKRYRARYFTARGRFDLYLLFFEQALRLLSPGGRLAFITPEKYLYVDTAGPLRELLAQHHVEEIRLVPEDTFGSLVTYPTITVLEHSQPSQTKVVRRDGTQVTVRLPTGQRSWLPLFGSPSSHVGATTLGDICLRVSCGVATGADSVFVQRTDQLAPTLRPFAHPTIAGRDLTPETINIASRSVMLTPYAEDGKLIPLKQLGVLGRYLSGDNVRKRLLARTCVEHKAWYAFHETPPLRDILRPKILCKDIGQTPHFWIDRSGKIVPRHSVYYIVPKDSSALDTIASYLRSPAAHAWLLQNCQRAAKGFLRLQSRVLQRMPVPDTLASVVADSRPTPSSGRSQGNGAVGRRIAPAPWPLHSMTLLQISGRAAFIISASKSTQEP
jgi:adenine-specific DNA-methyltransferase